MKYLIPVVIASFAVISAQAAPPNYEQHIKPLFRDHCLKCHNADESNADLDLSSFKAVMKGGSSGVVAKAGRPESSQLYRAVAHLEGVEAMPPESPKLPKEKLTVIQEWIRGGLIEGEGGKSQLRDVSGIFSSDMKLDDLPLVMPVDLAEVPLAETVRPPVPQALAASPSSPLIAVSGHEQVLLYSVASGGDEEARSRGGDEPQSPPLPSSSTLHLHLFGALPFPEGTIHDLDFSRNGTLLIAAGGRGGHSGSVVLFDVKTGKRITKIGEEVDAVLTADITSDHRIVALGGPSKVVKLFNTKTGELRNRISKHTDWITALAFSPEGKYLASGDRSGGIHVWESETAAIVYTLDEHKVRITSLDWRSDGKLLASSSDDGAIIIWDTNDGWPVRNIVAHAAKSETRYTSYTGVSSVTFTRDGRLISAGRDRTIRVWNAEGQQLRSFKRDSLLLGAVSIAANNQIVCAEFDGSLDVLTIPTAAKK